MRLLITGITFLTLISSGSLAAAADKDRSGFLFGLSIGSSTGDVFTATTTGEPASNQIDAKGSALSLKIGGAISRKAALYFLSQGSSIAENQFHSLTGIGATYYFRKTGTSIYVNGGAGFGSVSYSDDTISPNMGRAATVGIGIELGMGLNLEVNHLRVDTQFDDSVDNPGPELNYEIASTQFLIGYTWF